MFNRDLICNLIPNHRHKGAMILIPTEESKKFCVCVARFQISMQCWLYSVIDCSQILNMSMFAVVCPINLGLSEKEIWTWHQCLTFKSRIRVRIVIVWYQIHFSEGQNNKLLCALWRSVLLLCSAVGQPCRTNVRLWLIGRRTQWNTRERQFQGKIGHSVNLTSGHFHSTIKKGLSKFLSTPRTIYNVSCMLIIITWCCCNKASQRLFPPADSVQLYLSCL